MAGVILGVFIFIGFICTYWVFYALFVRYRCAIGEHKAFIKNGCLVCQLCGKTTHFLNKS